MRLGRADHNPALKLCAALAAIHAAAWDGDTPSEARSSHKLDRRCAELRWLETCPSGKNWPKRKTKEPAATPWAGLQPVGPSVVGTNRYT
jgi:hypothetical protein